eukprot:PhM_4_TR18684/c3_g3_i1/m.46379
MKTTLCRHHQIHVETQQALAEGRKPKPINRRHGGSTIAAQIKIREQGCPKGMYCPSAHGEHELNTPVLVAPSTTTTTTTQTATTSSSKPMNRRTVIVKATSGGGGGVARQPKHNHHLARRQSVGVTVYAIVLFAVACIGAVLFSIFVEL